ncbi:MAG TPA: SAM-dependent methyltransferase [Thermoanaerobaculia bacterium]|nr:SAM-dependent methyltransferase [Thermoanaerobaculia bacterium]
MELALYHPEFGYYSRGPSPAGKGGDFITAPSLSPVFSFALAGLFREFMRRAGGEVCSFVDIGSGDGGLVRAIEAQIEEKNLRFYGVDRARSELRTLEDVPRDGAHFIFSSELYDAIPFARLVQRGEHLHELYVAERDGHLDWSEHEAPAVYDDYFSSRGIELAEGQFADVALEWEAFHEDVARFITRGVIVTLDYGYRDQKLFHPRARRFGTAAAYSRQRVHRDLLADPGEQDLTAHINFADLERAGGRNGVRTLFFDALAKFLLAIGVTEHELFKPIHEAVIASTDEGLALLEARDEARRLILPDGMGEDLRVLVQVKGMSFENWSFQRPLF